MTREPYGDSYITYLQVIFTLALNQSSKLNKSSAVSCQSSPLSSIENVSVKESR